MDIKLHRFEFGTTYTIGKLYLDGEFQCFTLEDKVREVEGQPVSQWKIQDKTAIPKGTYNVVFTFSNRFQRVLPLVENVEGFTGIRIHSGNSDVDTDGCILVGTTWMGGDFIHNSQLALGRLLPLLQKADSLSLTIE